MKTYRNLLTNNKNRCFLNRERTETTLNFLLIDATDRSKISSDQKRFFIALSLYPLSFFANTPFNAITKIEIFNEEVMGNTVNEQNVPLVTK